MLELTDAANQMDLTYIYRTFHTNKNDYIFFSVPHGTFSKVYHRLEHVTAHTRILKQWSASYMTTWIKVGKQKIKTKNKKHGKLTNLWKLNISLLDEKFFVTKINKLKTF